MSEELTDPRERASAKRMLDIAARAGLRGFGYVEPNPMVGCVLSTAEGRIAAVGHHRRFGGRHAEIEALQRCREQGINPRGLIAFVTLEPCNHQGKTPACSHALVQAGIVRVVSARRDPHPQATGGAAYLNDQGVQTVFTNSSPLALAIGAPFIHRVRSRRPWVIAKWAQTIDARIATRSRHSQWISGEASRRRVHALRGRVDAVLTGIGTVLADDPLLTARGVPRRRTARRIVIDPGARTPIASRLVASIDDSPVMVVHTPDPVVRQRAAALRQAGVETLESQRDEIVLGDLLSILAAEHDVSTVLVEAGAGLLSRLHSTDLIDEHWIFTGPMLLADVDALAPLTGASVESIEDAPRYRLMRSRQIEEDVWSIYRRKVSID